MRAHPDAKPQSRRDPASYGAGPRPAFPAWIDAESGAAYRTLVTPRVRDGLVLRVVDPIPSGRGRTSAHASRHR
jgi:hypothetical protein